MAVQPIPERPANPPSFYRAAPRCRGCGAELHRGEIVQCPECGNALEDWSLPPDADDVPCNCGNRLSEQDVKAGHRENEYYCVACGRVGLDL